MAIDMETGFRSVNSTGDRAWARTRPGSSPSPHEASRSRSTIRERPEGNKVARRLTRSVFFSETTLKSRAAASRAHGDDGRSTLAHDLLGDASDEPPRTDAAVRSHEDHGGLRAGDLLEDL